MAIGEIVLVNDIDAEVESLKQSLSNCRVFLRSDFKIDDSRDVLNESFISSNTEKSIIIAGNTFNPAAQNVLLKVLEEPPHNVRFIIVTKSKNAILPTILSRMIITNHRTATPKKPFGLDLEMLSLKSIRDFCAPLAFMPKDESIGMIESLLFSAREARIPLSKRELDAFSAAITHIHHNGIPRFVMLALLLMLLENKRNHRHLR